MFFVACWGVHLECLGERNDRVFCGRERDHIEVWALIRFHLSLWSLGLKTFCIYSLANIFFGKIVGARFNLSHRNSQVFSPYL